MTFLSNTDRVEFDPQNSVASCKMLSYIFAHENEHEEGEFVIISDTSIITGYKLKNNVVVMWNDVVGFANGGN